MKITRRINVSVTNERRSLVVRRFPSANDEIIRCAKCAAEMIMAQWFAELFNVSSREIYRLIEREEIHFLETRTKNMYVCVSSLRAVLTID